MNNFDNSILLSLHLINDNIPNSKKLKTLYTISNRVESNYKVFKIKKHNGKQRKICEPNYTLKLIQRNILNNILYKIPVSSYAKAYIKGINLSNNAIPHINKKIILKLDIKDFFNNISFMDVYNNCFNNYPKNVGMLLTYLCTYYESLPQGAPTSAYISNIVMKNFDEEIGEYCTNLNIDYTRYSDDMTFSGDFNPSTIIKMVRKMLYKLGLEINNDKIHVINNSQKQYITGIVVNKKLNTDINYRKKIRQEIYYIKKYGIKLHLEFIGYTNSIQSYIMSLKGRINYVLDINKDNEFIKYRDYINNLGGSYE